jgi:polar amino acid transport system permease protein
MTMLESAVVSQIAVTDLTHVADLIQSRTYRAFETYTVITVVYLVLAVAVRRLFALAGRRLFAGRAG